MAETASRQRTNLPLVFDAEIQCPAGRPIGSGLGGASGVRCRVEHSDVLSTDQSRALLSYCLHRDGYRECPSWQAEKARIAEGTVAPLIPEPR